MEDILALVAALPDPRWRFGFQLMAATDCTLRLLPCDDWSTQWQRTEQYAPDRLPPMRVGGRLAYEQRQHCCRQRPAGICRTTLCMTE